MNKDFIKLVITFICLFSIAINTFGGEAVSKTTNVATVSTVKNSVKQLDDARERIHKRDEAEYKREQEDIAKRLNSLSKDLKEMRDKLVAMEVSSCSDDTCTAIVTIDGIAIENNKDNWKFRYYTKDNEFQTIKLWFKYDFVSDFRKLEIALNKDTASYIRDSFKRYNAKGELQ